MALALREAEKGRNKTWPNPWIGCVIVKKGKLLAKGFHEKAGFPHAEIEALKKAGSRAKGATMYVTLEPCNHRGKTGPCSQAILRAGVRRVVAAMPDPNANVHGGLSLLRRNGVEIGPWVLRAEAELQNRDFLRSSRLGRPWFILKAGASLDGKTALASGESKWITSLASRRDARRMRAACDAILVGAGTVLKDHPRLLPDKPGRFVPSRIVLDPRARLTGRERIFSDRFSDRSVWITGPGLTKRREKKAKNEGVTVIRLKAREHKAFIREAVAELSGKFRRILVEGGAQTHGAFLSLGLVDELALYFAPLLLGGERSKGIIAGEGAHSLLKAVRLKNIQTTPIGGDIKVQGDVHRNH